MDMSLIIFIIAFVILGLVVFNLVKKLIHGVFIMVTLFIFVIGGVAALVYFDYNNLTGQENYDIYFTLNSLDNNLINGVSLPVRNGSIEFDSLSGLSNQALNNLDPKAVKSDTDFFLIVIEEDFFYELVDNRREYDMSNIVSGMGPNLDLKLSQEEVKLILDSDNSREELISVLVSKNDGSLTESELSQNLQEILESNNLEVRQILFSLVILESLFSQANILDVVDGFKNNEINIYPEKFTFKLLKFIVPSSTIKSLLENSLSNSSK